MIPPAFPPRTLSVALALFCALIATACASVEKAPEKPSTASSHPATFPGVPDTGVYVRRSSTPDSRDRPTIVPPKVLVNPATQWPDNVPEALSAKVRLSIMVGADGIPKRIRVVLSTDARFNAVAVAAARKLRFSPATRDGQPVALPVPWTMVFKAPVPNTSP